MERDTPSTEILRRKYFGRIGSGTGLRIAKEIGNEKRVATEMMATTAAIVVITKLHLAMTIIRLASTVPLLSSAR